MLTFLSRKRRSETIISVGTGCRNQVFHVENESLYTWTAFIARLPGNHQVSSQQEDIELPLTDPTVFGMFVEWIKRPKRSRNWCVLGDYAEEPWRSNAATAWMLGYYLIADEFKSYALYEFIRNCALVARGPWKFIEDHAPAKCPLLRFSDHWVAWNCKILGPGMNEYTGLRAARLADKLRFYQETQGLSI